MDDIINDEVNRSIERLFPLGAGTASTARVQHELGVIAQRAYTAGKSDALLGLMTADDVAVHYGISSRRARAIIKNRHERFGVGFRIAGNWLVHRDELVSLEPEIKYRRK